MYLKLKIRMIKTKISLIKMSYLSHGTLMNFNLKKNNNYLSRLSNKRIEEKLIKTYNLKDL